MCYNFFYDRELLNQSTKKKVISHLFIKVKKKITSASKRRKEVDSEIKRYLNFIYLQLHPEEDELPHYEEIMCKVALENKFNRNFSLKEIREIIKDKSWQWRTASQLT